MEERGERAGKAAVKRRAREGGAGQLMRGESGAQ